MRVKGSGLGLEKRGSAARVKVGYGSKGDAVAVQVDQSERLRLGPLFARVDPDGCAWTLDKGDIIISMEKAEARSWPQLCLSGGGGN